jgi:hypothetical protein
MSMTTDNSVVSDQAFMQLSKMHNNSGRPPSSGLVCELQMLSSNYELNQFRTVAMNDSISSFFIFIYRGN